MTNLHKAAGQLGLSMHQAFPMYLEPLKADINRGPGATWPRLDRTAPVSGGQDALSLQERLGRMKIKERM